MILLTSATVPYDGREDARARRSSPRPAATRSPSTRSPATSPCRSPTTAIQGWIDAARRSTRATPIETFVGAVPDDLVASLCVLLGQLAVDAPSGAVDFEEELMTPQRYAEMIATDRRRWGGSLRDRRPDRGPRGRRPVDPRDVTRTADTDRLPVGHVRAPRAPRPRARAGHQGRQPARRPGRPVTTSRSSRRRTPRPTTTWSRSTSASGFGPVEVLRGVRQAPLTKTAGRGGCASNRHEAPQPVDVPSPGLVTGLSALLDQRETPHPEGHCRPYLAQV